jgi:hypothetical protein
MSQNELLAIADEVMRSPDSSEAAARLRAAASVADTETLLYVAGAYPTDDTPTQILCHEVIAREPDNERAWELLVRTLTLVDGQMIEERTLQAIATLERVNPRNVVVLSARMGQAYLRRDANREKQYAQELMAAHPLNMDGWAAYAKRIASEGRVEDALALLDAFILQVREADEPNAADTIHLVQHRKRQIESGTIYEGVWP